MLIPAVEKRAADSLAPLSAKNSCKHKGIPRSGSGGSEAASRQSVSTIPSTTWIFRKMEKVDVYRHAKLHKLIPTGDADRRFPRQDDYTVAPH